MPHPRTTLAALIALVAATAVASVVPLAAHARSESATPGAPRSAAAVTASDPSRQGALTADLDGDGRADTVRIVDVHRLQVRLASGAGLHAVLRARWRLEGVPDIGYAGRGIAISRAAPGHSRRWQTWMIAGDTLRPIPFAGGRLVGEEPGFATAWIGGDDRLYAGSLDPLQQGAARRAVRVTGWRYTSEVRLRPQPKGLWCWDHAAGALPAPCRPGQDYTYDVGRHGDLPRILPAEHRGNVPRGHALTTYAGDRFRLRRTQHPGPPETPQVDLLARSHGHRHRVRIPAGWAPTLHRTAVNLGTADAAGALVEQEGGDSDTWRVYVVWGGRLRQVATDGPVALGGGFTSDGSRTVRSWLTPQGTPYTVVGTAHPTRYRLYQWHYVTVGGPTLRATDLGRACLDEFLGSYGRCARPM